MITQLQQQINGNETNHFNVSYLYHYGIFPEEIRIIGNTQITTDYIEIYGINILSQSNIKLPNKLNNITIKGISKISLDKIMGILDQPYSNLTEFKMRQSVPISISFEKGTFYGTCDGRELEIVINSTSKISGLLEPNILLMNNPIFMVEGNVSLQDTRVSWPYIDIIGSQDNVYLEGTTIFQVYSNYDGFYIIRLNTLGDFKSHYRNVSRDSIIKYDKNCKDVVLIPKIDDLTIINMYTIIGLFLTFSLGYIFLVAISTGKLIIVANKTLSIIISLN